MADSSSQLQLVTFELGGESYGIDIMQVEGIVQVEEVRPIPHAPDYVEGIFNLRGEIIPVINLRKRFRLRQVELAPEDKLLSGFVIIDVEGMHLAVMIDKVSRVLSIEQREVQPPPQVVSGIGTEYIQGVVQREEGYLIILDAHRLFDVKELEQIGSVSSRS
jgi:purine-binding chemotaxis protein CheW